MLPDHLQRKADSIRKVRDESIPPDLRYETAVIPSNSSKLYRTCGILTPREITFLELDAVALAETIESCQATSVEVTEAFLKAAAIAQAATNCLTYLITEDARRRAKELDEYLEREGRTVGPLHGVPVSLKDFFKVKGVPQSSGHLNSAGYVPEGEEEGLVAILKDAGAVFYAKTTMPQTIMHLETSSYLFGVTTNPYNRDLTASGSSGGEGALLASRGSILGIGTDVGGSIRAPAAANGLWGYKPTSKRIPRAGAVLLSNPTTSRIPGVCGPMAHSLRDLKLVAQLVGATRPWEKDVSLVPIPWRDVDAGGRGAGVEGWSGQGGKLRVGVVWSDGVVRPVPPLRIAMEQLESKLSAKGVEVLDFPVDDAEEIWDITSKLYYIDGGQTVREILEEEPMLPLTKWITSHAAQLSINDVSTLVNRRNAIRQQWINRLRSLRVDVLVAPSAPAPALPLGTTRYWSYTSLFNFLDWPCISFPTGMQVSPSNPGHRVPSDFKPDNASEEQVYSAYSAEKCQDAPIGLQLIAQRWEDERLFAAMKIVADVLPLGEAV